MPEKPARTVFTGAGAESPRGRKGSNTQLWASLHQWARSALHCLCPPPFNVPKMRSRFGIPPTNLSVVESEVNSLSGETSDCLHWGPNRKSIGPWSYFEPRRNAFSQFLACNIPLNMFRNNTEPSSIIRGR